MYTQYKKETGGGGGYSKFLPAAIQNKINKKFRSRGQSSGHRNACESDVMKPSVNGHISA